MIFEKLVIHNYGIYKGRHEILLNTDGVKKPIVLFGGLNGGGKTTFLDALKLTLYGKFAHCSNRGSMAYHEYLKETINRHCRHEEGASLELEFTTYYGGEKNKYQIKRYWRKTGKSTIREEMEVVHNDVLDQVMTEQWYEYVNEFIPLNISDLFFFDGEKIEALADPEGSASLIKTGVSSLLGLDIIDKLDTDLVALMRTDSKSLSTLSDNTDEDKIKLQEAKLLEFLNRKDVLSQNLAKTNSVIDSLEKEIDLAYKQYRELGGDVFEQRKRLSQKLHDVELTLAKAEADLRSMADGSYPLTLIEKLINQTRDQSVREGEHKNNQIILSELKKRNKSLIEFLEKNNIASDVKSLVQEKLNLEIESISTLNDKSSLFLNVSPDIFHSLDRKNVRLMRESALELKGKIIELRERRVNCQRELSSVPEESVVAVSKEKLENCQRELNKELAKKDILEEQIAIVRRQVDQAELRLTNLRLENNRDGFESEIYKKTIDNVEEVKAVLKTFQSKMLEKHLRHLEVLILDSFRVLIRKSDLISSVKIDPRSYQVVLLDSSLEHFSPSRLSAGERQILAISILWGLAKASGRPLPLIIDTPLGRLDSEHRKHLVDNYFPKVSHQVILLSTDQEIDRNYRDDLKRYISREYNIYYDETEKTSLISEGYF
ncbi:DNA sulfur modification protein DndD [Teredinibacter turnerae]|uniref:DNA sulfur modification protein DndD n=1 Tax=Teredinibacter turnerae TaxID=2426 RepID=UPI0004231CF1|nr:DNA sulfur modification protein DndD [Teredinibacter turnerae]